MNATSPYLIIFDDFGYFIPNFYSHISPLKDKIKIDLDNVSYSALVLSFYYNYQEYILKYKEQCIPFDLFKDISDNTHCFNIFLLLNNKYITEEYLKLTLEEKEELTNYEDINMLFNEIQLILNIENF